MASSNEQNSSQDTIITTNSSSSNETSEDPQQQTFTDHVSDHDNESIERSNIDDSSTIEESNQNHCHLCNVGKKVVKSVKDAILGTDENEGSNNEQRPLAIRSTSSSSTIPIDESYRIAQEQISKTEEEFLFVVSGTEY